MQDWNSFLSTHINNTSAHSVYDVTSTYLIPLVEQSLIAINGPDAAKFLQGQATCDVRELANNQALLGAQCNIKGRMLLTFLALQPHSEQILLRIHHDLVANALTNLGKYIVFSKAKLADLQQDFRCLGVVGQNASAVIKLIFSASIEQDNQWQTTENTTIIRINEHQYELWVSAERAEEIWQKLAEHTDTARDELWNLYNIAAGIGGISPNTYEAFTPQAINWQLVKGINFRKGCYTGQEIVARLHYRGTLKRHMYRFEFNAEQLPLPNSALYNSEGKPVGEVILAAFKGKHQGELLASVTDDERSAIYLADNPQKLELLALPYAIPTADEAN